ncbi:Bms1-type G domain-containing protein, partial [Haematococcus lacustris]
LSVVHYSVRKASSYSQPLANKEELLLVTGLRSFLARPVFSTDTPGDKHKMERWLHAGQQAMATVFAPIAFPPLPLLAFKLGPDGSGPPRLAATGALRSCDPDRVVLKKIVLTGFPVRVHKRRCTVRYMFHDPDDIRWFRPVELYTRSGRRGRITEPLGTHGAMKTLFDGPVQQREVVCMSLYKRVFPKWPAGNDLTFAVRKAASYSQPLANKEELLLVTGLRSFLARPVFSTDTPGDKHKMERWLHAGQQAMATVFAPIAFPPLPLLAFKLGPDGSGPPRLAATGALRSCDPDRVVLKKIVLTGFPVRVHKRRCTVRYMFHDPDDIRWFRPVELYTRSGRRGRITEPLGTHGAMKTLFDGPVQQREVVCMSLYKRVFPKWPAGNDLTFA